MCAPLPSISRSRCVPQAPRPPGEASGSMRPIPRNLAHGKCRCPFFPHPPTPTYMLKRLRPMRYSRLRRVSVDSVGDLQLAGFSQW